MPLIFYDSASQERRVSQLVTFFEVYGDRTTFAIHNAKQIAEDLKALAASVDTHAERGDVKQAPSARMGSAVGGNAETPTTDRPATQKRGE